MMSDLDQNSLDNLSSIKQGVLKRRLGMEAKTLKESCSSISISIDENKGLPIVNVINEEKFEVNNVSFYIDEYYPFRPPTRIIVNEIEYQGVMLKSYDKTFKKVLHKLTGYDCLCCQSYVCESNWAPSVKLTDLVLEIRKMQAHKKNVEHHIKLSNIVDNMTDDDLKAHWQRCIDNKEPLDKAQFTRARGLFSGEMF
jgi:hypothetical protein